jgi:hypothetical protein
VRRVRKPGIHRSIRANWGDTFFWDAESIMLFHWNFHAKFLTRIPRRTNLPTISPQTMIILAELI